MVRRCRDLESVHIHDLVDIGGDVFDREAGLGDASGFRNEGAGYVPAIGGECLAGDELTATCRITDIYEKKGGLLGFIVRESTVTNQDGEKVATMRNTVVVQHDREKDLS